jgi:signal transduction histidine kinase/ligand-binding sensor domain-containing protein
MLKPLPVIGTILRRITTRGARWQRVALLVLSTAVCIPGTLLAQPATRGPLADQFVRTDFTVDDGLPDNVVNCIAQTSNGLLWVGTGSGLVTFDGREFTRIDLDTGGSVPQGVVHAMIASSQGDLWVGTDAGVVLLHKQSLDRFNATGKTFYQLGSESDQVMELMETRTGVLWAGTRSGLYRFTNGRFVQMAALDGVYRINETLHGSLLVVGAGQFLEWDGHRLVHRSDVAANLGIDESHIYQAIQDRSGTIWYATRDGLVRRGAQGLPEFEPAEAAHTAVSRVVQGRDGAMWMTGRIGLFRVDGNHLESPAPGLNARAFFPASANDLWIGTNGYGLIHLRRRVVRMFTKADGLPNDNVMAVLPAHDGTLWVGSNCGFSSYDGTAFRAWTAKDGLRDDCVWSLAEDQQHDLWIGTYGGGVYRKHGDTFTQYSKEQGLPDRIVTQIVVARDGTLWFATPEGLSHLEDGHFRSYTTADGLSSNQVLSIHEDRAGTLWVATQTGLDRRVGARFASISAENRKNGHFPDALFEDANGNLYTGEYPKGIDMIRGSALVDLNGDWNAQDMAEAPDHDLWFSGKNGIIRVRRDDLSNSAQNHDAPLDYEIFDRSDGLASAQCSVGIPSIVFDPNGVLWIATVKGLVRIDRANVPRKTRIANAFIGGITVGNKKQEVGETLTVAPGTHHLELHLETVDLASPEKVRMQYRMDDVDPLWLDADSSRIAIYSNLPPGTHNFHIRARSSDGVWNRMGTVYSVTQEPYFYQTRWFLVLALTLAIFLLSAGYLLRMRHVLHLAQMRMDERMVERERIARELHDTLLQGVLSASMQLDLAEEHIPEDSTAKSMVRRTLKTLRQLTEEGRAALRGLRSQDNAQGDLPAALLRVGQEVPASEKIRFRVLAPEVPRPLRPQIADDLYHIGREAILNAFLHAKASVIEVTIEDAGSQFLLRVLDDGSGIDPHILEAGRDGHWGLPGMRERAKHIGGHLRLKSRPGAGTEIELTVPASLAFEENSRGRMFGWLFRRLRTREAREA